jgi:hypothetical protein
MTKPVFWRNLNFARIDLRKQANPGSFLLIPNLNQCELQQL